MAIYEDRLIVGAPNVNAAGVNESGAAYVFVRAGASWGLEQRLESQSVDLPHGVLNFGDAVSLTRDFALVGNPTDHHPYPGSGAAHLFQRSGRAGIGYPRCSGRATPYQFDYYGHAVSVSDAGAFVGAPDVRGAGYKEGLVYAYGLPANLARSAAVDRDWSRYADILFGLIGGGPGVDHQARFRARPRGPRALRGVASPRPIR